MINEKSILEKDEKKLEKQLTYRERFSRWFKPTVTNNNSNQDNKKEPPPMPNINNIPEKRYEEIEIYSSNRLVKKLLYPIVVLSSTFFPVSIINMLKANIKNINTWRNVKPDIRTIEDLYNQGEIQEETKEKIEKFIEQHKNSKVVEKFFTNLGVIESVDSSLLPLYVLSFSIQLSCREKKYEEALKLIKNIQEFFVKPEQDNHRKLLLSWYSKSTKSIDELQKLPIIEEIMPIISEENEKNKNALQEMEDLIIKSNNEEKVNEALHAFIEKRLKDGIIRAHYVQSFTRKSELTERERLCGLCERIIKTDSSIYVGQLNKKDFISCLNDDTGHATYMPSYQKSVSIVEGCYRKHAPSPQDLQTIRHARLQSSGL